MVLVSNKVIRTYCFTDSFAAELVVGMLAIGHHKHLALKLRKLAAIEHRMQKDLRQLHSSRTMLLRCILH